MTFSYIYTIKTNNTNHTIATFAQHRTVMVYTTVFDRATRVNERYYNRRRLKRQLNYRRLGHLLRVIKYA